MTYLTKDAILAANDRKVEEMEVEEWGGTIRLMELSAQEAEAFATQLPDSENESRQIFARIIAAMIVDDDGTRVFTADDIEALGGKSIQVIRRVATTCMELSGLTTKGTEDEAKN